MTETTKSIERVGAYSTLQCTPEDCTICKDAMYATMIVDGICLECLEKRNKQLLTALRSAKRIIKALHNTSIGWEMFQSMSQMQRINKAIKDD